MIKGNQFWRLRQSHGRKRTFKTPSDLWEQACRYFEWVDENPIIEEKLSVNGTKIEQKKLRPYTKAGLCYYLNCSEQVLRDCKKKYPEYERIMEKIEQLMYAQKFEGAAAGIFNHQIIARDLGLADKNTLDITAKTSAPDLSMLSNDEIKVLTNIQKKING
jgi:hypothetical protein